MVDLKLSEVDQLVRALGDENVRLLLEGDYEAHVMLRPIDVNAPPRIHAGEFVLHEHRTFGLPGTGMVRWNPTLAGHYADWRQKGSALVKRLGLGGTTGTKLLKRLNGAPCLNANFQDFLLRHQEQIPADWSGHRVFFFGTLFRRGGVVYVSFIVNMSSGLSWQGRFQELSQEINERDIIPVLKQA